MESAGVRVGVGDHCEGSSDAMRRRRVTHAVGEDRLGSLRQPSRKSWCWSTKAHVRAGSIVELNGFPGISTHQFEDWPMRMISPILS